MVETNFDMSIQKLESNIKSYVQNELSNFFKEQQNIYEIKKLMEHDFVKNLIIENRTLKNENDKLKQKINIITKNIPKEYPNDEPNVFWEVIEKEEKEEDEERKNNNENLPKTYKENKKMVHIDTPNNYYLMGQDEYNFSSGSEYSDSDEILELTEEELVYKESINTILEKYDNVNEDPTYISIGLNGMDIHLLESQCQKYEIEDKFYHIILDLAKKNYASFSNNKLEDISYTQVLGLSAGIIKWALLNGEDEDEEDDDDEDNEDNEEDEEEEEDEDEEEDEEENDEDEEDNDDNDAVVGSGEEEVEEDEVEEEEEEEDEEVKMANNTPPLIQGALLAQNNTHYATIDTDSEEEEEEDDEALEVEEYILEFEGQKTKTYKDDEGYIYQYLDDEEIGEILGQLKDGIFIAS